MVYFSTWKKFYWNAVNLWSFQNRFSIQISSFLLFPDRGNPTILVYHFKGPTVIDRWLEVTVGGGSCNCVWKHHINPVVTFFLWEIGHWTCWPLAIVRETTLTGKTFMSYERKLLQSVIFWWIGLSLFHKCFWIFGI